MKIFTHVLAIALFLSPATGQTKRPSKSVSLKKAPVTIQTATTKDGRTVLLKSDGACMLVNGMAFNIPATRRGYAFPTTPL